jgi:sulfite dehydrogenase
MVKHLNEITVVDAAYDGYWMKTAYRIPDNDCACVTPGGKPDKTRPIARLNIRSFLTSHASSAQVAAGRSVALSGIAFDGGAGVARVDISADGGQSWQEAALGEDLGRYSFRAWRLSHSLPPGRHRIQVRATSRSGEVQPVEPRWQPAGYMRNVIETVEVIAA